MWARGLAGKKNERGGFPFSHRDLIRLSSDALLFYPLPSFLLAFPTLPQRKHISANPLRDGQRLRRPRLPPASLRRRREREGGEKTKARREAGIENQTRQKWSATLPRRSSVCSSFVALSFRSRRRLFARGRAFAAALGEAKKESKGRRLGKRIFCVVRNRSERAAIRAINNEVAQTLQASIPYTGKGTRARLVVEEISLTNSAPKNRGEGVALVYSASFLALFSLEDCL